jgi:hypothetical protein
MSLSDLAALGSFVSGAAVVISFIFLALQMRQSNSNQRSLMQQGRSARNITTILKQTEPSMSETMDRAFRSDLTMTREQVRAFTSYAATVFWSAEDSFLQFQKSMLDAESWATEDATLRAFMALPAYRVAWQMNRAQVRGNYRRYLDSLLREVRPVRVYDEFAIWKDLMEKQLADAV